MIVLEHSSTRLTPSSENPRKPRKSTFRDSQIVKCLSVQEGVIKLLHRVGRSAAAAALVLQASIQLPAMALESPPMTTPDVMHILPPIPTEFPVLPKLRLPKFTRTTLPNGLRLVLVEDHEVPIVRGLMLMRGGQRASPSDKVGLATISAAAQRAGGSQSHPGQKLEIELEDMAAGIEGGASSETVALGFSCLSEDVQRVLMLFSEIITEPAMPEDKVNLFKSQALNSVAHRNDNPSAIPAREAAKFIYGRDSVFFREPSIEQIASISSQDAISWLEQWERPDTSVLGIVGDFKTNDMKGWVQQSLGAWTSTPGPPPPLPTSPLPDQSVLAGHVFLVDRPGATQASVAMAELGVEGMHPDECALDVLGGLLNSFGGRLFDDIRSREGLVYSVNAGWTSAPPDHPGLFMASAETAHPAELLKALQGALQDASSTSPSLEDVLRARDESLNSFVFGFSSVPAQLRRAVTFDLLGIPEDYVFRYQEQLVKVTPKDVERAAGRHLHPEKQVIVVVGDARVLRPALEAALGRPVEMLSVDERRE